MNKHKLHILLVLWGILCSYGVLGQTMKVQEVLAATQKKMQEEKSYSCHLDYSLYASYTSQKYKEHYEGTMIKFEEALYTKINVTTFLNTSRTSLKINENQQAMEYSKVKGALQSDQSPLNMLTTFIKLFKTKTIEDKGSQWLCTLSTDVITQLPFGKVEIYINKENNVVTNQVLYFLTQMPYLNERGERVMASPRLEIKLSNFKLKLSKEEEAFTKLSKYIKNKAEAIIPVGAYKDFKIIKRN